MHRLRIHLYAGSRHQNALSMTEFLERAKNYTHFIKEDELMVDPDDL